MDDIKVIDNKKYKKMEIKTIKLEVDDNQKIIEGADQEKVIQGDDVKDKNSINIDIVVNKTKSGE